MNDPNLFFVLSYLSFILHPIRSQCGKPEFSASFVFWMVKSKLFVYNHTEIAGNVKDEAAAELTVIFIKLLLRSFLFWTEIRSLGRAAIKNLWQEQWDSNPFCRLYFNLNPSVLNSTILLNKNRSETLFVRLHTGYITLFLFYSLLRNMFWVLL